MTEILGVLGRLFRAALQSACELMMLVYIWYLLEPNY